MTTQDRVQSWTQDGARYTRLIDCSGRITEWGPTGMLCRQGCGEDAAYGTGGSCRYCAGLEEYPEGGNRP